MKKTSDTFADILASRTSRRKVLAGAGSLAVTFAAGCGSGGSRSEDRSSLGFVAISHGLDDTHHVADGYAADILVSWGEPIFPSGSLFDPYAQNGRAQQQQFGANNDYIAYFPLGSDTVSADVSNPSDHGLLCVNHEHININMMFPSESRESASRGSSKAEVEAAMAAVGHSIIEVRRVNGRWRVEKGSAYTRRITATTPMVLTGPAAGDVRLKTPADPTGARVLGTFANCSGGVTPWGTILIAEENFREIFAGNPDALSGSAAGEAENHRRFEIGSSLEQYWHLFDDRFNIEVSPTEPNRFGWIVEIDPYDPRSTPRKRTALGRCQHENAAVAAEHDNFVVVYSGDDKKHECVYKFVSESRYDASNIEKNQNILDAGTLYVARFNDDGTGTWLPLVYGEEPLVPENGFRSQADVLIDLRLAARLLGATRMDRPEDIEISPVTCRTYIALTKNDDREATDAANPRIGNLWGHILELIPPGSDGDRDHAARDFEWQVFALAGDPTSDPEVRGVYHEHISDSGWLCNPDNLAFDPQGRLWVATDGFNDFGVHDGLWATETVGPDRARFRHFFGCPNGGELCGPAFTPDGRTLFVAVQHPGRSDGSTFEHPATRWPDFDPRIPPRSSVVAITKNDDGEIGS